MNESSAFQTAPRSALTQLKLFLALSRTPHALIDMATPAATALLWHGSIPPARITLLGLITAFAGYTSVYALNDLVDHRVDRARVEQGGFPEIGRDLDAVLVRHPLAYDLLTLRVGVFWAASWALLALLGAYLLNPICAGIFLVASLLEVAYCIMWRTSYLKTLISGVVKTSGAVAAVFAVDPEPSVVFVVLLFLWLFFWEVGGQNVPNDWSDVEEDKALGAKTIPLCYGTRCAMWVIVACLAITVAISVVVLQFSSIGGDFVNLAAFLAVGVYLLLIPAYHLFRRRGRLEAYELFNKASYYPLACLAVVVITLVT
jgi:4-hydroxybenzoate polyprenyltransferase